MLNKQNLDQFQKENSISFSLDEQEFLLSYQGTLSKGPSIDTAIDVLNAFLKKSTLKITQTDHLYCKFLCLLSGQPETVVAKFLYIKHSVG